MALYTNNRSILRKFYYNDSFPFFKVYTKEAYFDFLNSKDMSYYSYDNHIEFPYCIKKKNEVEVTGYYLLESFPDFVYSKHIQPHVSSFTGMAVGEYIIEESYLKDGPKGLCIQTRNLEAIELLIGMEQFVCFKDDLLRIE